jgi:phosphoserine aminotransferase
MLVLSPRAVERLESHGPAWPLPKLFRLTKGGKLIEGIFKGETINTPSMLAVEDALDGLRWAEAIGGLPALAGRCQRSLGAVAAWLERSEWAAFLAKRAEIRSPTSVCLSIVDGAFTRLDEASQQAFVKEMCRLLAEQRVAFDIQSYRDAPAGLRIWCGATIETADVEALLPWLDWAYAETSTRLV